MIELHLDKTAIAVGDILSGTLVWKGVQSQNKPKKGTLTARWRTEGRGTRDRQIIQELPLDPEALISSQGLSLPFSIQIPYDGPITYNGALIRILWELEAVIEMPGLFAKKDKQTWPIQVICR
ncbi:MAG: hypothetical protein AAF215_35485 [Cyanobacteria bacterium P01_A01_bin.123]